MIKLEVDVDSAGAKDFPEVYTAVVAAVKAQGFNCRVEATIDER